MRSSAYGTITHYEGAGSSVYAGREAVKRRDFAARALERANARCFAKRVGNSIHKLFTKEIASIY